jgi:hypothetical protein
MCSQDGRNSGRSTSTPTAKPAARQYAVQVPLENNRAAAPLVTNTAPGSGTAT